MKYRFSPFLAGDTGALLVLFNKAITGRREAAAIHPGEFSQRVLEHPGFEPEGLLLARESSGKVVGFIHAVLPPVHIPLYAKLAGRGYLFGPWVDPAYRDRGIGRGLLKAAEGWMAQRCETILVHGLRAPFYHTREGPRQPYFGSTEILGLTGNDTDLLEFYAAAGYGPVEEQELSMTASLQNTEPQPATLTGLNVVRVSTQQPWKGRVVWIPGGGVGYGYESYFPMAAYDTLAVAQGDTIVGHCQWYSMRRPGRAALFDLRLEESLRGRGIGRWLFEAGLAAMYQAGFREVELHTSPQRNAAAYRMYRQAGFKTAVSWVILKKTYKFVMLFCRKTRVTHPML
ncbi:MAG: GNAT family N-acetyltransferase [Anaerolineales bacterium]|nr:GNAT family N-acetyltransferase [Anaerolineales bacterium]